MALTQDGLEKSAENRKKRIKEVDSEKLFHLASIGFSMNQVADYFGIGRGTIEQNMDWLDCFREGRSNFEYDILFGQHAVATDPTHRDRNKMLVHLGKVQLGQTEKQQIEATVSTSFEELLALSKKL